MKRIICAASLAVTVFARLSSAQCTNFLVDGLRVEQLPVVAFGVFVDTPIPRFSWALSGLHAGKAILQEKYQVVVVDKTDSLAPVTVWDSGTVASNRSVLVSYGSSGDPTALQSHKIYEFIVSVTSSDGQVCNAGPATFRTAALTNDDAQARSVWEIQFNSSWIGKEDSQPQTDCDCYKEHPHPLLRRAIDLQSELGVSNSSDILRAHLYVVGLGYGRPWVDGRRVGSRELGPAWTTFANRTYYSAYDVTDRVVQAAARAEAGGAATMALGVELGNGYRSPLPMLFFGHFNFRKSLSAVGPPILRAAIVVTTRSAASATANKQVTRIISTEAASGKWRVGAGSIVRNNVYLGEEHDNRLAGAVAGWTQPDFEPTGWPAAVEAVEGGVLQPPTSASLRMQFAPPVRVMDRFSPSSVTKFEDRPGQYIVSLPKEIAGWLAVTGINGSPGAVINMTFGEILYDDGSVNAITTLAGSIGRWKLPSWGDCARVPAVQMDRVTLAGTGDESFEPQFTFHAFRHVQISGWPDNEIGPPTLENFEAVQIYTGNGQAAASLTASDPLLQQIDDMTRGAFQSNWAQGIQSDCPGRERLGYGGDLMTSLGGALATFDAGAFYRKRTYDYAAAQMANGGLPETAPFVGIASCDLGGNTGPIEWGAGHLAMQAALLQSEGDARLVLESLNVTRRWMQLLNESATDYILPNALGYFINNVANSSCFGKDAALQGTAFFYQQAVLAAAMAETAGKHDWAAEYKSMAEGGRQAFQGSFVDESSGIVGTYNNMNEQVFGVAFGLTGASTQPGTLGESMWPTPSAQSLKAFAAQYQKLGHTFEVAAFGTWLLMNGAPQWSVAAGEAAFGWVSTTRFPSYGYMLANGATTTLEHWDTPEEHDSWNHAWLNSVLEFLHGYIAGIRLNRAAVGSDDVIVGPIPFGWRVLSNGSSWGFAPGERPAPLTHASSSRLLPTGNVSVDWMIRTNSSDVPVAIDLATQTVTGAYISRYGTGDSSMMRDGFLPEDIEAASLAFKDSASGSNLVFAMEVELPGNTRSTVKVPLCKAGVKPVQAQCNGEKLNDPAFTAVPVPAMEFKLLGVTHCNFSVQWDC